jgi:hypothetical protein
MTINQYDEFQLIKSKLETILLSDEQVYLLNTQFDSLIAVAENFDRKKEFVKSAKVYTQAKTIYKNSCTIAFKENPQMCSCIYNIDGLSKIESRLQSRLDFMLTLRNKNDYELTNTQMNQVYTRQMDEFIDNFSFLQNFYNANLESRVWVSEYVDHLKHLKIIII